MYLPDGTYFLKFVPPLSMAEWYRAELNIKDQESIGKVTPFINYETHRVVGVFCTSEDSAILIKLVMN